MRNKRAWKRRKLVVSPAFQWSVVLKAAILTTLVASLITWSVFYFVWKNSVSRGNLTLLSRLFEPDLWIGLVICLIAGLALSALLLLRVTHRVAGQVYRFERTLDQLISGDAVSPIFTRKQDYFHDFEADLNRYLSREGQP